VREGRDLASEAGQDPQEGSDAYILEEWGIDGELRRTLHREAPWWRWRGNVEISPAVRQLHLARNGLLYLPRHLFRGSLLGYQYKVGADGLPFVEIVEVRLVPE
jgi:hypothetical protein